MPQSTTFNLERVQCNLAALAALQSKNPDPGCLSQYTGWGGLREAVYQPKIYWQMKKLLNDSQIASIKATLKTGYYTPEALVTCVYEMLQVLGVSPRSILEPSAGHGVFIANMPPAWRKTAKITAVEMDEMSSSLLRHLYPDITTHHQPFETFQPDERFDLIVGNPPYGQMKVEDSQNPDLAKYSIHHYFVGKCMRLLNEGGMLAMVLPRYFLDAPEKHVRHILAKEGISLVAAYRLPDDLFDDAKVTVDIVLLKKGRDDANTRWVSTTQWGQGGQHASLNQYFIDYPQHVIGELGMIQAYGRAEIGCKRSGDVYTLLQQHIKALQPVQPLATADVITYWRSIDERLEAISCQIAALQQEKQQWLLLKARWQKLGNTDYQVLAVAA